jgi:dihydroorotase
MAELLQKVRVIDPVSRTDQVTDVLISDGYIQAVGDISQQSSDTYVRDCRGLVLGSGLIDLYSHSGEPGFEERETLTSLLAAAKAGGFTRICILPDTSLPIDNPAVVAQIQRQVTVTSPTLQIWGAISQGLAGKQMTDFWDLVGSGVIGFTDGLMSDNLELVRRVLEYLQPLGKPVAFTPCDRQIMANGVMRSGVDALRLGLPPIPAAAETSAIASLLELVAATNTPVHIMGVSTARSVELIAQAKAQNLPITASTTWMHLLLDTKAIKSYNTSLRLQPPLGNASDKMALREGIRSNVIDAIAIDHAPYTYEEKTVAFAEAPPGAIGYELALPLLWQHLVETGEFTALLLWQALSSRPAECLKQKISAIAPGEVAELTLFNPQQSWKVEKQNLCTLSVNTPWLGQQLTGKVEKTWGLKL